MRRLRTMLFTLAMAGLTGLVAQADGLPSRVLTFLDDRSGISLTIETAAGAPDAGRFVLRVPGLGHYVGLAGEAMRVLSPTSVVIRYSGEAMLHPAVDPDGTIIGLVQSPLSVNVAFQSQIDPTHHTAEATLRDGARRYHLVARVLGRGDLERTMRAVEEAFVADDPAALYPLVNGDLRAAYIAEAFESAWRAQSAEIGRVTAMRRTALGEPQTNELGFAFVIGTYEVERLTPLGDSETTVFEVFFVREGSSWKLLFSRPR